MSSIFGRRSETLLDLLGGEAEPSYLSKGARVSPAARAAPSKGLPQLVFNLLPLIRIHELAGS